MAACKGAVDSPDSAEANASGNAAQPASGIVLSGTVPADVVLPQNIGANDQLKIRPNFDDFSWRTFIALNWPVDPGQRGAPKDPNSAAAFLNAGASYATVWDSYRTAEDLYVTGRPIEWNGAGSTPTPCSAAGGGVEPLIKLTKMASSLSDLNQAFSFPLVDQNGKYVRYEIYFNQVQYDALRGTDDPTTWLYRLKQRNAAEQKNGYISLPMAASSPYAEGATMVKAAWREMVPADDIKRYYTRQAVIYDTSGQQPVCRNATVGLIGLHIARKLSDFPQWVWSSFEHIDNVPFDDGSLPPGRMSLNNGKPTPVTQDGYSQPPPGKLPVANPAPVQVTRVNPIPTTPAKVPGQTWPNGAGSTVDVNNAYRAAVQGSVWANYQLVITQWPFDAVTPPTPFKPKEAGGVYPQDAGGPFPLYDAVNTALETYLQARGPAVGAGGNSCMQCHYGAGREDFSWSLRRRPK
ncbi:MAG TPA: hypothetical protein VEA61_02930 [Allosphingosinicella sp.]|nr:hypothetical protein [Allosphingosinicella sp.]